MTPIVEIDAGERLAVVQPGVVNDDLRAAVAEHGLWYPPDPASAPWSTIGGNVATNAGGLCCVKYGVTRDYVLALEVVTGLRRGRAAGPAHREGRGGLRPGRADGRLGGHARGGHRGHGPPAPAPGRRRRGRSSGSSTPSPRAARRSPASRPRGLQPAALELVDRHCLQAVERVEAHGLARRTPRRCCSPARTCPGAAGEAGGGGDPRRVRGGRRALMPSCRPTRRRPRRCSPPGGSPTRRWSGCGPPC